MPLKGSPEILFEVTTPMGFRVRVTRKYWRIITELKHPVMKGKEQDVMDALRELSEIRRSKQDQQVYLFYKPERPGRWICAVTKRLNGDGFLITTYPTDAIKEGEKIWPK